ncbi:MAG: hypothetical protein AAFQ51_17240 [Pseudomonadota bacterium]
MKDDDDENPDVPGALPVCDPRIEVTLRSILRITLDTPERILQGAHPGNDAYLEKYAKYYPANCCNAWDLVQEEIAKSCDGLPADEGAMVRRETLKCLMKATSSRLRSIEVFERFCVLKVYAGCLTTICLRALDPDESG